MSLDLTTFTRVDPSNFITDTALTATFTNFSRNAYSYLYSDYGAGYFSGQVTSYAAVTLSAGVAGSAIFANTMSIELGDWGQISNGVGALLNPNSPTNCEIFACEKDGGAYYESPGYAGVMGTTYYLKMVRSLSPGLYGTFYVYIYSDAAMTNLLNTQSITLHTSVKNYRYFYALQGLDSGSNLRLTGQMSNVSLALNNLNVAFTTDNAVISVAASTTIPPPSMAVAFTTANATVSVTGTGSPATIEEFGVLLRNKSTGLPMTGLSGVQLHIWQLSSGLEWDYSTNTFVSASVQKNLTLVEVDPVNQPGLYRAGVFVTTWNGWVQFEATYNDGTFIYSYQDEAHYTNGLRASGTLSGSVTITRTTPEVPNSSTLATAYDASISSLNGTGTFTIAASS